MHWNHRLCKETKEFRNIEVVTYSIREVYYNENNEICLLTEEAANVYSEIDEFENTSEEKVIEEVNETLIRMQDALNAPVVDIDTLEFAKIDGIDEEAEEYELNDSDQEIVDKSK